MGVDSCLSGREFVSQRHIPYGSYFTFICCKNCVIWLSEKEAANGQYLKKKEQRCFQHFT